MGASFLLTRHVPSLPRCCRQTLSKTLPFSLWGEKKGGYRDSQPTMNLECVKRFLFHTRKGKPRNPRMNAIPLFMSAAFFRLGECHVCWVQQASM